MVSSSLTDGLVRTGDVRGDVSGVWAGLLGTPQRVRHTHEAEEQSLEGLEASPEGLGHGEER